MTNREIGCRGCGRWADPPVVYVVAMRLEGPHIYCLPCLAERQPGWYAELAKYMAAYPPEGNDGSTG